MRQRHLRTAEARRHLRLRGLWSDGAWCAGSALALATLLLGVGCGQARRDTPYTKPLALSDQKVALGQKVFMTHCSQCHPSGSAGLAPAINDKPLPGWLIKYQVRRGLGAMPGFDEKKISEQELDAIPAYLKALRGLKA